MSEDLISNNFVGNINRALVKRNLKIINVTLIFVVIYTLAISFELYIIIINAKFDIISKLSKLMLIVEPVCIIISVVLSLYGYSFLRKANKFIYNSFEKNDHDTFNQGYLYFIKASYLTLFAFLFGIIHVVFTTAIEFALNNHLKLY